MARLEHAVRPVKQVLSGMRAVPQACVARPRISFAVWVIVLALLAAGVGALWWQDHRHDQIEAAREAAIQTTTKRLAGILSYQHSTVDKDLTTAQNHLTGDFKDKFATLGHKFVAPSAKRDKITTTAKVVDSSVVSATPTDVVALVYVNQTTQSATLSEPRIDNSRLRVSLTQVDDHWRVSDLKPL